MADNNFRASRSREPVARDDANAPARDAHDPLAELARLIGQGDRPNEFERDTRDTRHGGVATLDEPPPAAHSRDWADDDGYAEAYEPDQYAEDNYVQPRLPEPHPDDRGYAQQYDRDDDRAPPPPPARYAKPAEADDDARYGDDDRYRDGEHYRDDARSNERAPEPRYRDEEPSPPPAPAPSRGANRKLPALAPQSQSYDDDYENDDEQWDDEAQADGAEDYDGTSSGVRRSGLVIVLAMLGLVFVGAAGAFAYRSMFGGAILAPGLPPVIKANNGPNKIMPNRNDAQSASNQGGAGNPGSAEKLVSREEQPVAIQPPNAPPRVMSTIPVLPDPNAPPAGALPANNLPAPNMIVQAPPAAAAPAPMAAPPKVAPPAQTPAAPPAGSAEPKKIHTLTIRTDQNGNTAAPAPAPAQAPTPLAPPAAARPRAEAPVRQNPAPAPAPRGQNAPLALVPTAEGAAPAPVPEPRGRMAHAEASGAPMATAPAPSAGGGGYAVQVTSQRSEAEAQSAYKALQAKFPSQLGSHQALIHRADLGDKGTYYRAMVGPFGSAEAAASMCSSLKAAGGSCLVQRN